MFFLLMEKLKSPAGAIFKNPNISLLIGKNLEVQPNTNTKNPNFESKDDLENLCPMFHC